MAKPRADGEAREQWRWPRTLQNSLPQTCRRCLNTLQLLAKKEEYMLWRFSWEKWLQCLGKSLHLPTRWDCRWDCCYFPGRLICSEHEWCLPWRVEMQSGWHLCWSKHTILQAIRSPQTWPPPIHFLHTTILGTCMSEKMLWRLVKWKYMCHFIEWGHRGVGEDGCFLSQQHNMHSSGWKFRVGGVNASFPLSICVTEQLLHIMILSFPIYKMGVVNTFLHRIIMRIKTKV